MNDAEFDRFADKYDETLHPAIAQYGEDEEYFAEYKIQDIARELRDHSISDLNVLDFGAGNGASIPHVRKHLSGASLTCLDVSQRSLDIAAERYGCAAEYVHFNGEQIPLADEKFHIAYAACVFHHIDHEDHISLLKELYRVLHAHGTLFVFEHNPYNPLTVRIVKSCALDVNARLIQARVMKQRVVQAGFADATVRYRVFVPQVLRWLRPLERGLAWLPLGGQYYVKARKCA